MNEHDEDIDLHVAKCDEARAWPSDWTVDGLDDWDEGPIPSLLAYRDEQEPDDVVIDIVFHGVGSIVYVVCHAGEADVVASREAAQARYDELLGTVQSCGSSISSQVPAAARSEP